MDVSPIYAGLLALMFVALSLRVISERRSAAISLGDGGNETLMRRGRVHSNFAEYVPLAVILMVLLELQNVPAWSLHLLGITLILGRSVHAYGVAREPEVMGYRVIGMALTFTVLIGAALATISLAII